MAREFAITTCANIGSMPAERMRSPWPTSEHQLSSREADEVLARSRARIAAWHAASAFEAGSWRESLEPLCVALCGWVAKLRQRKGAPIVLGIAGAQGTGKSTLAALLAILLGDGLGLRSLALSLDDLYLTRAERQRRARELHPLLVTRGVPGTHDTDLGARLLFELCAVGRGEQVACPRFDKAKDERTPKGTWPLWQGPTDVVLFEGWCLGAQPQPDADLIAPINRLEREEDRDARFRAYVNAQLAGPYRALFGRIDALVFLAAPDMASVRLWRGAQERELAARTGANAPGLMTAAQLERFVQYFERISLDMLAQMPARADVVLQLGRDHGCERVYLKG